VVAQEYEDFSPVLITDKTEASKNRISIKNALAKSPVPIEVFEIDFFAYGLNKKVKTRRKIGEIIADVLKMTSQADAVVFVAPNEKIFSNHLQVLAGSLARNPDKNCAATSAILLHRHQPVHGVHEKIDFRQLDPYAPIGYARFIFRVSALPDDLNLALPYVDRKAMAILVGECGIAPEIPSTVLLYVDHEFPSGPWDEGQENELISSFCPAAFAISTGHEIVLPPLQPPLQLTAVAARGYWLIIKLLRWRWIVAQARLLRKHGVGARFEVLKRKLKSGLV